jgi:hypothetical protein
MYAQVNNIILCWAKNFDGQYGRIYELTQVSGDLKF